MPGRPAASSLRQKSARLGIRIGIAQELFETEPKVLEQLLSADGVGEPKWCGVVENYASDLRLARGIQPDLLEAMLPHLWGTWQGTLLNDVCREATSELHSALFHKPQVISETVGPQVQSEVEDFVRESLLFASDVDDLSMLPRWVPFWTSVASFWPTMVGAVWDRMADGAVVGHARSLLVYISRIAYSDAENPLILDQPRLETPWAQASFDSRLHWGPAALAALEGRLDWSKVEVYLGTIAARTAADARAGDIASVASDIRERRKQAFIQRRSILLRNLGRGGLDKFWDDELGVA